MSNPPKKILVMYATSGAGHRKAAEAVREMLTELPQVEVKLIDALEYSGVLQKRFYSATYLILSQYLPWLWKIFYYAFDTYLFNPFTFLVRYFYNWLNSLPLLKLLKEYRPHLIISTHFYPAYVANLFYKRYYQDLKVFTVITDFKPHFFWILPHTTRYIVASEETKLELIKRGVTPEKILCWGIPVEKQFQVKVTPEELRQKFNLQEGLVILIIGSGISTSRFIKLLKEIINSLLIPFQILVVCGRNPTLYQKVKHLFKTVIQQGTLKLYKFVNNMAEFMTVSDMIITKPGGVTLSEALTLGLPVITLNPTPGQEERNVGVAPKYGIVKSAPDIPSLLQSILEIASQKGKKKSLNYSWTSKNILKFIS